jgi:hypothetical protein
MARKPLIINVVQIETAEVGYCTGETRVEASQFALLHYRTDILQYITHRIGTAFIRWKSEIG